MLAYAYILGYYFLLLSLLLASYLYFNQNNQKNLNPAVTQASNFVVYKDAVQNYAEQNPSFSGSVPISSLVVPNGIAPPNGFGDYITPYNSARAVISYYSPIGTFPHNQPQANFMMDWIYGYVNNGNFYPYLGNYSVSIPGVAPQGDVMSFNIQSGNGQ